MQDLSLFFQAEATDDDLFPFSSLLRRQPAKRICLTRKRITRFPQMRDRMHSEGGLSPGNNPPLKTLRPRKLHLRRMPRRMEML